MIGTVGSDSEAQEEAGARRSGRTRKAVEHFKPEERQKKPDAEFLLPKGEGEKLGDIANIERRLSMTNANELFLKRLHRIMFPGGRPVKATVKKQVRQFAGWELPADEGSFKQVKLKQLMEQDGKNILKPMCQLLDLQTAGSKAALAERVYDFLCKPESSGKSFKFKKGAAGTAPKKRKASETTGGSARGPTSYFLFMNANRAQVRAENPDLPTTEIAKLLGAKWRGLSQEEQDEWKAKAAALKPEPGSAAPPKKKQKQSRRKTDSEEDDDATDASMEESEEEEEEEEGEEESEEVAQLREGLTTAVKKQLEGRDLENFKLKQLLKALEPEFGEDVVSQNKDMIKEIIQTLV